MRKLLIGIAFLLPLSSFAELRLKEYQQMDLICFDTNTLFKELRTNYEEVPFFYGETDDNIGSTMSFWLNKGGETWTIVVTKKELSCVIAMGKNLKLVKSGKQI